ncbi:MAG: hypothetical protein BWX73_01716 [Lentisphaerae bacterium ADurb.Bin082]|nr:MAG: hypothetical protein BWX73_01716 [Lentisphaerae bacterium ADurb.Bin082]
MAGDAARAIGGADGVNLENGARGQGVRPLRGAGGEEAAAAFAGRQDRRGESCAVVFRTLDQQFVARQRCLQGERHRDAVAERRLVCRSGNFWQRDGLSCEGFGPKAMEQTLAVQDAPPGGLVRTLVDDQGIAKAIRHAGHSRFANRQRRSHEKDGHVVAVVKSQAAQRCHAGGNADGRKIDDSLCVPCQHVCRQCRNALGEDALVQAIIACKARCA